jgi:hypothetical protein
MGEIEMISTTLIWAILLCFAGFSIGLGLSFEPFLAASFVVLAIEQKGE